MDKSQDAAMQLQFDLLFVGGALRPVVGSGDGAAAAAAAAAAEWKDLLKRNAKRLDPIEWAAAEKLLYQAVGRALASMASLLGAIDETIAPPPPAAAAAAPPAEPPAMLRLAPPCARFQYLAGVPTPALHKRRLASSRTAAADATADDDGGGDDDGDGGGKSASAFIASKVADARGVLGVISSTASSAVGLSKVTAAAADASSKLASADASSILEAHRRVAQKAGGLLSNFMSPTKSRDSANE